MSAGRCVSDVSGPYRSRMTRTEYETDEEARLLLDEARRAGVVVKVVGKHLRTEYNRFNRYFREALLDKREAVIKLLKQE